MKTERPILFSGPMVRTILEGRKTQTRRVCRGQPMEAWTGSVVEDGQVFMTQTGNDCRMLMRCPYGQPGDRIWVRETWCEASPEHRDHRNVRQAFYKADGEHTVESEEIRQRFIQAGHDYRWRPSIHMPRWASRIDLEITAVRVERLLKISKEDAIAEGAKRNDAPGEEWDGSYLTQRYIDGIEGAQDDEPHESARAWYSNLWESINGPHSWVLNPWVWVVEFKRVEGRAV